MLRRVARAEVFFDAGDDGGGSSAEAVGDVTNAGLGLGPGPGLGSDAPPRDAHAIERAYVGSTSGSLIGTALESAGASPTSPPISSGTA